MAGVYSTVLGNQNGNPGSVTNRKTDVTDEHFTRVDVTEEFPLLW